MDFQKPLTILIDSEIKDLYDGPPKHFIEELQLYFALNDDARVLSFIRNRFIKKFLSHYFVVTRVSRSPRKVLL